VKDFAATGIGPGFVPRIVAVLLFGLGAVLLVKGINRLRQNPIGPDMKKQSQNRHAVLKSFLLFCVYISLLKYIGFILMTLIYLFLQISLLAPEGRNRPIMFGVISVITSVTTYFLFVKFFRIMIPAGILG
jgi:hypothetical protein